MQERRKKLLYETLGYKIKLLRMNAGLSQEKFGDLIGLSRPSIVNIEAGRQQPSLHVLLDMSMALNFDILSYIKSEFWQTSADKKKKVGLEEALSKLKVAKGTKSTISAFITKHSG